jgi:uncharacterized alpha-E superfamily protein
LLPVLDLLLLDESNPHSVCFQLAALCARLEGLHQRLEFHPVTDVHSLLSALRGFDLGCLDSADEAGSGALTALLLACERSALALSDELTQRFFIHAGERPQASVAA